MESEEPERGLVATSRMRLGFVIAGAIIVLSTAGATVGVGMVQINHVATTLRDYGHTEPFRQGTITAPPAGKPQTLLLVGSDRRYGDARGDARSDTLMLIRLNPKQSATTVLSIPRDLRVTIPGHGIDKVNAAYGLGGLDLTTRTITELLTPPGGKRFRVNHAIAVNFKGFREAVDIVNCVYIDVDRRYYHSNLGVPSGQRYAEIDVQPGYQRLCGQRALDYVRFRHLDNDIVRADRQQGFLREASAQMSTSRLLHNLNPLVKAFAKSTSSDSNLQTSRGILRLLRLAASSSGKPVRQVTFPHTFVQSTPAAAPPTAQAPLGAPTAPIGLGDYVTATPEQIQAAVRRFMHPRRAARPKPTKVPKKRSGKRRRARVSAASYGLVPGLGKAKALVRPALRRRFKLPFYAPAWMTQRGRYPASTGVAPAPRLYTLPDRGGKRHQAYRLVVAENETEGQYYGIQGTTWRNPPILDGTHSTQRMAGRTYRVYNDGAHIRLVAWETPRGVYWVSNSLSRALSNREMLGIARSLTRISRG
jgi:polyisoprenyl-teichoic acid--peptidoglycan teichoic acid transferase